MDTSELVLCIHSDITCQGWMDKTFRGTTVNWHHKSTSGSNLGVKRLVWSELIVGSKSWWSYVTFVPTFNSTDQQAYQLTFLGMYVMSELIQPKPRHSIPVYYPLNLITNTREPTTHACWRLELIVVSVLVLHFCSFWWYFCISYPTLRLDLEVQKSSGIKVHTRHPIASSRLLLEITRLVQS